MSSREDEATTDAISAGIRSGVAWKAGSQVAMQIIRMVVALVLARLLAPHDWGLAAMVLVFAGFVVVFTDNALGTALIQRRKLTEEDRSTVFWINVVVGLVLALAGIGLAGPLAAFYGEPAVRPLLAAISIGFLISSLGTTHSALLIRDMEFRKLELRQMVSTAAGAIAGITIALEHHGAWAIVGQQLGEGAASTLLLWSFSQWRPRAMFSIVSLRRLGSFAGNVFGENLLFQAGRNLNSLLIGRFLGPVAIGTYGLSTNVILVPFSRIAGPLQQVFFPAFSRMGHDRARMTETWIRATRLVGLISLPSLVGLVVVAPEFVQLVLGSRWHHATPVIQILACVGVLQSLHTLSGEVLLALNRPGVLFRLTLLWFVLTVGALALGLHWGIIGVAVCYTAATILLDPVRTFVTTRALGVSFWRFYGSLLGVAQATALMAAVLLLMRPLLVQAGLATILRLTVLVGVGAAVYLGGVLWRAPEVKLEIRGAIGRRRIAVASRVKTVEAGL
jgi:O-antigen/teichoic acid export membrane protein